MTEASSHLKAKTKKVEEHNQLKIRFELIRLRSARAAQAEHPDAADINETDEGAQKASGVL